MIIIYSKDGLTQKTEINKFTYNGTFMGECFLSATITSPTPINFELGDYAVFRNEQFTLNYTPAKGKKAQSGSHGEAFIYENIKLNSLADELTRCDFLDYVLNDNLLHHSQSPNVKFYANSVQDLVDRIQANLNRLYIGAKAWEIVVSPDLITEAKEVLLEGVSCWEALALVNSLFGANFIIKGRKVSVGTAGIAVGKVFGYGKGKGLYDIGQVTNEDAKIITRLRVYGSTRNMPHLYYNKLKDGSGKTYIPELYYAPELRLPDFPKVSKDPYLDSPNISKYGIREGSVFFNESNDSQEVFPSLEGMTKTQLNNAGISISLPFNDNGNIDEVLSVINPTDNGKIPEEPNKIPKQFTIYFKDLGFDLSEKDSSGDYKYATSQTMQVAINSGMCSARNFDILENGIKKDTSQGYVRYKVECNRFTDDSTSMAYPNADWRINTGDKFVLLGIDMPEVYIKAASEKLLVLGNEYLTKHDKSQFTYLPKIDEVFMARNPELGKNIKEGDILNFDDTDLNIDVGVIIQTLKINIGDNPVPTYEVSLSDKKISSTVEKMQNSIDTLMSNKTGITLDQIKSLILSYGSHLFLSKLVDDIAEGNMTFVNDVSIEKELTVHKDITAKKSVISDQFGNLTFTSGQFGSGFRIWKDAFNGQSYAELDNLLVRRETIFNKLTIAEIKSVAGQILISPANLFCSKIETLSDGYKCYFDTDSGKIANLFAVDDQAICRQFNGQGMKYYWRRVTSVGADFIVLSKTDCDGSGVPAQNDEIIQFGNRTNINRQSAILISAYGSDAPSIKQYAGVNSYNLTGKEATVIAPSGNKFSGTFEVKSGGKTQSLDDYTNEKLSGVQSSITDLKNAVYKAQTDADKANSSLSDIANDNLLIPSEKQDILKEWQIIQGEKPTLIAQAQTYALLYVAYETAYNNLNTYITPLLANLTVNSVIVGNDFRAKFKAYYDAKIALLKTVTDKAKSLADAAQAQANSAQTTADTAKTAANNAQTTADTAKNSATTANSLLSDIANDNKLTATEKQDIKKEWDIIVSEYSKNSTQANTFSVATANYTNTYNTLNTYITPLLANLNVTSDIVGTTFRTNFKNYYDARTDLLNAIATKAKQLADAAQNTANLAQTNASKVESSLKVLDDAIKTKVSQTDFNSLTGRVSTAESTIIQQAGKIESTVTKVDGKNTVFKSYTTAEKPSVPYAKNDIWVTFEGVMKQSKNTRLTGTFVDTDWVVTTKYTDDTAVNNLQIGSRNLIRNSNFSNGLEFWSKGGNGILLIDQNVMFNNLPTLKVSSKGTAAYDGFLSKGYSINFEKNTEYILSFWAYKGDDTFDNSGRELRVYLPEYNGGTLVAYHHYRSIVKTDLVKGEWKFISIPIKSLGGTKFTALQFDYSNVNSNECNLWLSNIQLEKGNKATDWTPAPEDVQTDIDKAQIAADKANNLLADIANDNKLTATEKQDIKKEWDAIVSEYSKNIVQANSFSVITTTYTNTYNVLNTYITPLLANLNVTSDIVGTTFRANFKNYYDARTDLLNGIAKKAKDLADTAQGTADAKNRTYYSDTTPAVPIGGHKTGDLWYKISITNGCYTTYRWNGTAWNVINEYVSKAQQTITDSSITNLVTKTGINLLGNGESLLSKINQTADQISLEVGKIQVGSRNLIPMTNQGTSGWSYVVQNGNNNFSEVNTLGVRACKSTTVAVSTGYHVICHSINRSLIKNSTQYTLSMDVYCDFDTTIDVSLRNGNGLNTLLACGTTAITKNTWNKVVLTATSNSDATLIQTLYIMGFNKLGSVLFANLQVEEGNKATSWSPSPEDIGHIAGSALTLTDNKISLASKTIELNGTTIAKAIQAEDLKVGSRTGLSALEVLKNGTFYAKGSKNNQTSLTIDSENQSIEVISPYSKGYGEDSNGTTTIKMSGQSGNVDIRNNDGVTIVSAGGVFANKAVNSVYPAGTGVSGVRAAIAGLGFGNRQGDDYDFTWGNPDNNALVGVAGRASNSNTSNPAPAFGGYFDNLKACGFLLGVRKIMDANTATAYLDSTDSLIIGMSGKQQNIYLPMDVAEGRVVFLKQWMTGYMRVYPRYTDKLYDDATENSYIDISEGWMAMCVYIRQKMGTARGVWLMSKFKF